MDSRLLISASRVLIGPAGERLSNGAVLVQGREIVAVGPERQVESLAPPDTMRLDLPNCTILPGLIDCHVHLAFDADPGPKRRLESESNTDARLILEMAGRARQLL